MPDMNKLELNNSIQVEINTAPSEVTEIYSDMRVAFKSIAQSINEVLYSASYLADGGFTSHSVVGAAPALTLTGDYFEDDAVCEFLNDIQYEIGSARCTTIKITRQGEVITCPVTLTSIAISGGESNAPNSISVTASFNGKPTITTASA